MGFGKSAKKLFSSDDAPIVPEKPEKKTVIMIRTPESFNDDAKDCADGLLQGKVVMINLQNLGGAERNRIFDYMNGVAYIQGAYIDAISDSFLIYCPSGVELDKKEEE